MATKPSNVLSRPPDHRNAKPKVPASETFSDSVTNIEPDSNANGKGGQWYTFSDSVTLDEQWTTLHQSYFNRSMLDGCLLDNTPVCCVYCKRQYLLRSFYDHSHESRCEQMWEYRQLLHEQAFNYRGKRRWQTIHERYCSVCWRTIYSNRTTEHRVCWKCRQQNQRDAVRKCQQQRRVTRTPRGCDHCGVVFTPSRSTARYCSTKCRVAEHRMEVSQ